MQAAPPSFRTQAATTFWHEIAGVHLDQCAGVLRCLKLATSSMFSSGHAYNLGRDHSPSDRFWSPFSRIESYFVQTQKIAAVTVTYNRLNMLTVALEHTLAEELDYIVIVNNNSTDGTAV